MAGGKRRLVDLVVDRYVNLDLFYRQQRTLPTGCVEWTGITNNVGYGFIGFKRIDPVTGQPEANSTCMMTAHRLAFMIHHKRLPSKPNINHTCHNKLCVNPDHLTEGTQQEKMRAMRDSGIKLGGPAPGPRGSYNHKQIRNYKYTEEYIQWIRTADVEDIIKKLNINRTAAVRKQWGFRVGYRWLPCPAYERRKTGRPRKVAK
jgi:hypothetical protein